MSRLCMSRLFTCMTALLVAPACVPNPDDSVCLKGSIEPDLSGTEWKGAGVVDGKLTPGNYVIAATYIKLSNDGYSTFQKVLKPIEEALPSTDGLIGYRTLGSRECFTGRTISVWRDEAAVYRFVASDAHAAAMAKGSELSRGGSLTTHWADTEQGATLEKSAQMLAEDESSTF